MLDAECLQEVVVLVEVNDGRWSCPRKVATTYLLDTALVLYGIMS